MENDNYLFSKALVFTRQAYLTALACFMVVLVIMDFIQDGIAAGFRGIFAVAVPLLIIALVDYLRGSRESSIDLDERPFLKLVNMTFFLGLGLGMVYAIQYYTRISFLSGVPIRELLLSWSVFGFLRITSSNDGSELAELRLLSFMIGSVSYVVLFGIGYLAS